MGCGSSKSTDVHTNENNPGDKTEENKEGERDENKGDEQEKKADDAEIQEKKKTHIMKPRRIAMAHNLKLLQDKNSVKRNTKSMNDGMVFARDKFGQEALEAHNKYRAKHSTPELTLNPELRKIAQKWADHLASEKSFEHSKTEDRKCSKGCTGENLFYSGSTGELEINGSEAVESWYNEIKDYDFKKPGFAMNTGHFTQVVWEGSKEVGFGFATYQDGEYNKLVVVGNYYPAGNIMKQFEDNVKAAKDEECDKKDDKPTEKKQDKNEEKKKPEMRGKGK